MSITLSDVDFSIALSDIAIVFVSLIAFQVVFIGARKVLGFLEMRRDTQNDYDLDFEEFRNR